MKTTDHKTTDKQAVKDTALELIAANGKTTNLEVKEALRTKGYWATQDEVREFMKVLAGEENWARNYAGTHFEYSIKPATTTADTSDSSTTNNATTPVTTPATSGTVQDQVVDSISESLGIYKQAIKPSSNLRTDLGFSDADFDKVATSIGNKVSTTTPITGNEINGCKTVSELVLLVEKLKA